jgi:ABC-type polysaccharide/polyol phosphate export permease
VYKRRGREGSAVSLALEQQKLTKQGAKNGAGMRAEGPPKLTGIGIEALTQVEQISRPQQISADPQIRISGPSDRLQWGLLIQDFLKSAKGFGYWLYSSWMEVLLNYRSTVLGPLWIVVGTGVFVFTVGTLYNRVVLAGGSNIYLAHLAVGMTLWFLFIQSVVKSCGLFLENRGVLLDGAISYTDLLLKLLTTNIIYFLHNLVIVVLVFVVLGLMPGFSALIVLFTLPLVLANVLWMCALVSVLGTRYADLDELIHSTLRLVFFVTPILWIPHKHVRGVYVDALLYLNPFYYFIEVVRQPLLYGTIPWFEIGVLVVVLPIGWLLASYLYARTRDSVALWL